MNFDQAKLLWSLPWDADWVSAVSFIGPRRVAAGNHLGEILVWELPENPEPAPEPPADKNKSGSGEKSERPLHAAPPPARQLVGHTNVINRCV